MLKKNEVYRVEITDQDNLGQGIGKVDGFPLFVRHAVKGDVVDAAVTKVKKSFGFARIAEIISPSKNRKEADCDTYKRCGGCQLQLVKYDAQLEIKQNQVAECLKRIGKCTDIDIENIIPSDNIYRYRNKAQYPIGKDKDGKAVSGFFAERTHDIIPCSDCLLTPEEFSDITADILCWIDDNNISVYDEKTGKGLIRHLFIRKAFSTGDIAVCLVINGNSLPNTEGLKKMIGKYPEIRSFTVSINKNRNNVIMGNELKTIYGSEYIEDSIGDVKYRISPLSFYQINPAQTKKLYDKVIEFAEFTGNETVLDLYCGIGTISLYMARKTKSVTGIEIVPQAIEDANENKALNNIENAEFYTGKAEEVLPELYAKGLKKADVVVVDPPRKGCDETALSTICDIAPNKLIYVSCNPATLARDVKYLEENGFHVEKVQPVDMFPNTVHVETVVLMSKGGKDEI